MKELYIIITSLIIFFVLLAFGISSFVLYYNRKKRDHLKEKEILQKNFENSILQTQIELQEQIFKNISEEVHDNVGQILSLAKVELNILEQHITSEQPLLSSIKDNLSKAMNDLRDIARSLNGERIQTMTLEEAIALEIQKINQNGFIKASIETHGLPKEFAHQKKLVLFRMVQETLQNCIKHAAASTFTVSVNFQENQCEIQISDDGVGFDVTNNTGMGLTNLKNRAKAIGGNLIIESDHKGTALFINAPYN